MQDWCNNWLKAREEGTKGREGDGKREEEQRDRREQSRREINKEREAEKRILLQGPSILFGKHHQQWNAHLSSLRNIQTTLLKFDFSDVTFVKQM